MRTIYSILPNAEALLALEPEELAGFLLVIFNESPNNNLSRSKFGISDRVFEYPNIYQDQILRALIEAWAWLENEGFIAHQPKMNSYQPYEDDLFFVTRRCKKINKTLDLDTFRKDTVLNVKSQFSTS